MTREDCLNRLTHYLNGTDSRVRFVNAVNHQDLQAVASYLDINGNVFLTPKSFSKPDENTQLANLFQKLQTTSGAVILRGFTTQTALLGDAELRQFLRKAAGITSMSCKIIILCYQCGDELDFSDSRQRNIVYFIDGNPEKKSTLHLLGPDYPTKEKFTDGIENAGLLLEKGYRDVWIRTAKVKSEFSHALWPIVGHHDVVDALLAKESVFCDMKREWGTHEQWTQLLEKLNSAGTWNNLIQETFGTCTNLEIAAHIWATASEFDRWLYVLALRLNGSKNDYLNLVLEHVNAGTPFAAALFRTLIDIPYSDPAFINLYNQRKFLIASMGLSEDKELFGYIRMVGVHSANAIRYLTDATLVERKQIISLLSENDYDRETILSILTVVYPDLAAYLNDCPFKEAAWLEEYFREYRFSKVTNKISEKLREMAMQQAVKRDYNLLPPRTMAISGIPQKGSFVYWIDALGVEFLAYIRAKCNQYGLTVKTSVCCANLPSLTRCNKDFWDEFSDSQKTKVSELDEIKHHGKEDYDYQKTPLPIHLSRELEIIDEVLFRARNKLLSSSAKRVLILSDHGASRMAVIKENIIDIDVNSRGAHGGRVCEYTDSIAHVPYAVREGDWYILASYDRFKGGQKASVEVHGGATPEEVIVPVIQLSIKSEKVEVRLMTPVIEYSYKQEPVLEIFSEADLEAPCVLFEGNWILPETDMKETRFYRFVLPKKKGNFTVSVYDGDTVIASDLAVTIKNKVGGMNSGRGGIL